MIIICFRGKWTFYIVLYKKKNIGIWYYNSWVTIINICTHINIHKSNIIIYNI